MTRATPAAMMPGIIDAAVIQGAYEVVQSSRKASMPMKCMDQTPRPSTIAPNGSQIRRLPDSANRLLISKAKKEAAMAIRTETVTQSGS